MGAVSAALSDRKFSFVDKAHKMPAEAPSGRGCCKKGKERHGGEMMSSVIRVYVEKREGFDVEARHMLADLKDNLGIRELEALRLLNRYDIQDLTEEEFRPGAGDRVFRAQRG